MENAITVCRSFSKFVLLTCLLVCLFGVGSAVISQVSSDWWLDPVYPYSNSQCYSLGGPIVHQVDVDGRRQQPFLATFTGGQPFGGYFWPCLGLTLGYGTRHSFPNGSISQLGNKIAVDFHSPVGFVRADIEGKYPQRVTLAVDGKAIEVDLENQGNGIGRVVVGDPRLFGGPNKRFSTITVSSNDPDWAFSIRGIMYRPLGNGAGTTTPSEPSACGAAASPRPAPENISRFGWTMHSEISDDEGLVLTDVRLNGRLMAERISVPYFNVATSSSGPNRGVLRPDDAGGSPGSRLVSYDPVWNDESLIVRATYAVDNLPQAGQSCLNITQRYEFTRSGLGVPCEPSGSLACQKYRAVVSYAFKGSGAETLRYVDVAQRNHFTVNGAVDNSVGLFRDCDARLDCASTFGYIFKDKINPLFSEHYSPVIIKGRNMQQWDNMHQTFQSYVTEPRGALSPSTHWSTGGCPECLHTHWRWGSIVPDGERFGNGKLLIPSDSDQDLSIGIARYRTGEERPTDFRNLILLNPESIRTELTGHVIGGNYYKYTVPGNVVYWLMASGYKNSDEFFSYYSFFNPDSPNETRSIESVSQPFTLQDRPVSVTYAHLFEDGDATYTEIDPSTVAQLPSGYNSYAAVSHDIRTEAEVSGPHIITFNLPSVTDQTTFNNLRVLHSEPDPYDSSQAIWVDRTILPPDSPAPDFANRKLYAKVNHVGPFLISTYTPPAPNTNAADLSVSINDSADPVTAPNQLSYTATVNNNGPNTATDVLLTVGLSPDVIFESVNTPQGTCHEEESTVMCKLGTIASGANVAVTITVRPFEGQTRFPNGGKLLSTNAFVRASENDANDANNSETENTNALPQTIAPPKVEIQVPRNETVMTGPATFDAAVVAGPSVAGAEAYSQISQVEFLLDGVAAGTCGPIPNGSAYCSVELVNVPVGEHSLLAVATNMDGRKAVSDTVTFFVNGPADISLDVPFDGFVTARPADISLSARASIPSGSIANVEFFADGLPIGNGVLSGTNQYTLTWSNAPTGVHLLRAVATDGNGVKSYSYAARVNVTNAPTVSMISPAQWSWFPAGSNIVLAANASDFDGNVRRVDLYSGPETLYAGDIPLTQEKTYSYTLENAVAGTYSFAAKVTDASGYSVLSSPVNFTVTDPAPPSDLAVWRPSNGTWYILGSSGTISQTTWGVSGDRPVPGDFDADGVTDFSIFRPSTGRWYIVNSSDGSWSIWNWGVSTDIPAPADYDGDGRTDPAVYRPSEGKWYIQGSSSGFYSFIWGESSDIPAPADFDGDGKADASVWRISNNTFYSIDSFDNEIHTFPFSQGGGKPVCSDYDGDGKADYATFNPSTGYWYVFRSSNSQVISTTWGQTGDIEVYNDYDGDGRTDFAVWRPSNGTWYIRHFGTDVIRIRAWGENGDTPVPAFYNR